MRRQMKARVLRVLGGLAERERKVLSLRFGFGRRKGLSLRGTSARVGLSQEGVRRVEKKALEKLRQGPALPLLAGLL
jgi:RNA polymerase primary sigma factor